MYLSALTTGSKGREKSLLETQLAVCPWVSYLTSLSFSSLISLMEKKNYYVAELLGKLKKIYIKRQTQWLAYRMIIITVLLSLAIFEIQLS